MIEKYLLVLCIGHVLGDFYFQTNRIAENKDKKFSGVIMHSFEYMLAAFVTTFPFISVDMLLAVVYMSLMHFGIDSIKYVLIYKKKIKMDGTTFSFKYIDTENFE